MKKAVIFLIIGMLLLASCGGSKTTGKRVAIPQRSNAITGNIVGTALQAEPETTKTAAQVLKELQAPQGTGAKSGTFYPPVTITGTEREALKQKTRALFQQQTYDPNVQAQTATGSRYYDKGGNPTNLPPGYGGDNED